jgi:hypothetical protein
VPYEGVHFGVTEQHSVTTFLFVLCEWPAPVHFLAGRSI